MDSMDTSTNQAASGGSEVEPTLTEGSKCDAPVTDLKGELSDIIRTSAGDAATMQNSVDIETKIEENTCLNGTIAPDDEKSPRHEATNSDCSLAEHDLSLSGHFAALTIDSGVEEEKTCDTVETQLKKLYDRMNGYEKQVKEQNQKIRDLKGQVKEKDEELEKNRSRNQDIMFLKNRLKEKEKEIQSMKQEYNRNRNIIGDLQCNMKQIHHQIKTMTEQSFDFDDRLSDIEKLSPMMGVFEWRIENYRYNSLNSEYLLSNEFYTHLNGYCCYLSVQWFGSKCGRLGLYLHLNKKKNLHLVENCKIKMLIQCIGSYGLTKEHLVTYDAADAENDRDYRQDNSISGDDFFLLKPYLDKYLIDDCLYIYCHLLPHDVEGDVDGDLDYDE